jgi:HAE1 family hydrophobic/amphiphilic exporter-1
VTAAVSGSREVALAILAGTLTTIAVFVPVVFIGGFEGVFFKEMAVVVCFALLCALLVALTLVPAAAARLLRDDEHHGPLAPLFERSERWLERLDEGYARSLRRSLTRPGRVVAVALALLALSLALFPVLGFELMPTTDEGRIDVSVELPVGTPVESTGALMRRLEDRVRAVLDEGELAHLVTLAGPESWWRPAGGHRGSMEVMLVPVSERSRSVETVADEIQEVLTDVPGAEIRVHQRSSNPLMRMTRGGGEERLAVEIRGHELAVADRLAERVVEQMEAVPGVSWARADREEGAMERTLHLDRSRLADLGLTGGEVADAVEHYVLGRVAGRFRDAGEEVDIRVQLAQGDRELVEQLPRLPIVTPDGRSVPLEAVATFATRRSPASINREDQQRLLRVEAGTGGRPLGDIAADVSAGLDALEVPEGFSVRLGGELEEQRKVFTSLLTGIVLAVFLVYTVMAIQFESLLHPLIIMTSVPLSLIGVVVALLLTGTTFNMNSFLGTIVLVGIVVNNAIVLVDYVNLLRREEHKSLKVALIEGGRRRLRPILMTSLTTALGLLPIAIGIGEGSEIQAPLARVVIGGLASSTLLTLFFVPCLYLLVETRRRQPVAEEEEPMLAEQPALGTGPETVGA